MDDQLTKRGIAATFLVLVMLFAGCLGGGSDQSPTETNTTQNQTVPVSVTQHDGLTTQFTSQKQVYREGQPIVLELGLENTGQGMANGITTRLTGASFIAGAAPQYPGRASLRPVDTADNQPGENTNIRWQIPNPVNLDSGVTQEFPAKARVAYDYQTKARTSFTAVSGKDYSGKGTPVTTHTSAGPLTVDIQMKSPTPVYPTDTSSADIPVTVEVTNQGDGTVADLYGDALPVHVQSATFPNTNRATLVCPNTVSLFDGTGTLSCTAHLPADVIEEQFTMEIDLSYKYFEKQGLTFTVKGLQGDQAQH